MPDGTGCFWIIRGGKARSFPRITLQGVFHDYQIRGRVKIYAGMADSKTALYFGWCSLVTASGITFCLGPHCLEAFDRAPIVCGRFACTIHLL